MGITTAVQTHTLIIIVLPILVIQPISAISEVHYHRPPEKYLPSEPLTPGDFKNARTFPRIPINYEIDEVEIQEEIIPDTITRRKKFKNVSTTTTTTSTTTVSPTEASTTEKTTENTSTTVADTTSTTVSLEADNSTEIINWNRKWSGGIIPYTLSGKFSEVERAEIAKAVLTIKSATCIQFVPRVLHVDYVNIIKNDDSKFCGSAVGCQGGCQELILTPRCLKEGHILHEMMHTIGFDHEQSRIDRDEYVTVIPENIKPESLFNFKKFNRKYGNIEGSYDLGSITHYSKSAFAKKTGLVTIIAKNSTYANIMGQREGLSQNDRDKVNRYYQCHLLTNYVPFEQNFAKIENADVDSGCQDLDQNCPSFSKNGYCHQNIPWMSANCRRSCNNCGKPCTDFNNNCSAWAAEGECGKNHEYMQIYCRESCFLC